MKNVGLYIPKIKDLWFRQQCMKDPETMSYNSGYDVSYLGYSYKTGCINFPEENWKNWFTEKMLNPNFYYAYIVDNESKSFVGYVNFNIDNKTNSATMGIVIYSKFQGMGFMRPAMNLLFEEAKKKNIEKLTDTVPENRVNALKVFFEMGFTKKSEFLTNKFGKPELVYLIEKELK